MKRLALLLLAILGTVLQYILIELILSLMHWMYNRAKEDLINKPI
jgi:hypothetical protein